MSKHTERNNKTDYRQIKKAADRVGRIEQKVIGEYLDMEMGCMVKVLEGIKDTPFRTVPTGWSD